jgi:hypothetical protein
MYYAVVGLLMFALPLLSCAIEAALGQPQSIAPLVAKWFVFWAVGVRLGLAGLRQIVQPAYTAHTVLGIEGDESLLVVRELGFANAAIGLGGLISFVQPAWRVPMALVAGVFYGMAGINHALERHRNRLENVAMVSDLFAAVLLLSCVALGASN